MRRTLILVGALLLSSAAMAEGKKALSPEASAADDGVPRRQPSGLSVFANAGTIWADDNTANFYSGRPENANTILRVLHSETYGRPIWQQLKTDGLISPAIANQDMLTVAEYGDMYYHTSLQFGLGIRYDYESGFGWLLRFDLSRINARGAFNLSSTNGTGILTPNQYIRCGLLGREDRINIDFAITRTIDLGDNLCFELDLGASLNNTKVKESLMEIDGYTCSILDIWNGQSPSDYTGSYEYINQGGLGWGVFMSGFIGYRVEGVGAIKAGYTCHHSKTTLEGYTAMGWVHCLTVRFEINNFSFL